MFSLGTTGVALMIDDNSDCFIAAPFAFNKNWIYVGLRISEHTQPEKRQKRWKKRVKIRIKGTPFCQISGQKQEKRGLFQWILGSAAFYFGLYPANILVTFLLSYVF